MIIVWGFLAGLLCSLGGALKDSPYEGFSPLKFTRSILVGVFWGALLYKLHIVFDQPVFAICVCGYLERITVEGYKIMRAQKPGKFTLPHPSQLGARFGFTKVEGGEQ
jgi:hypothetical protein